MSSDVIWHIRDKLRRMPKHGSILLYVHGRLVRTDSPGRPPRLSHSSWTMRLLYPMTAEHHFIPFGFVPHVICLNAVIAEPYYFYAHRFQTSGELSQCCDCGTLLIFMPIDFRPHVICLNPVITEPYYFLCPSISDIRWVVSIMWLLNPVNFYAHRFYTSCDFSQSCDCWTLLIFMPIDFIPHVICHNPVIAEPY